MPRARAPLRAACGRAFVTITSRPRRARDHGLTTRSTKRPVPDRAVTRTVMRRSPQIVATFAPFPAARGAEHRHGGKTRTQPRRGRELERPRAVERRREVHERRSRGRPERSAPLLRRRRPRVERVAAHTGEGCRIGREARIDEPGDARTRAQGPARRSAPRPDRPRPSRSPRRRRCSTRATPAHTWGRSARAPTCSCTSQSRSRSPEERRGVTSSAGTARRNRGARRGLSAQSS
jgi:hypothetical protein